MGLLYVYLVAWVVGGVLLGARILLTHREPASSGVPATGMPENATASESSPRGLVRGAAGLIGFGMFGLLAEGLGLLAGTWTALCAVLGGVIFVTFSHLLRSRL